MSAYPSTTRSTCGGLALPPRQAAPLEPSAAGLPKGSGRLRIAAGITGAAAAFGAIRRAVAERGFS